MAGTIKRLVGEIVGDGRLADDGARQANHPGSSDATVEAPPLPSEPRKTKGCDTSNAVVKDAPEGEDLDLVEGEGGEVGLGDGEDLNRDD